MSPFAKPMIMLYNSHRELRKLCMHHDRFAELDEHLTRLEQVAEDISTIQPGETKRAAELTALIQGMILHTSEILAEVMKDGPPEGVSNEPKEDHASGSD